MDDSKDDILKKLEVMPSYELDKHLDKKRLELKDLLREYYKVKDTLLFQSHAKRRSWLNDGHSYSKVEQMLRADEDVYKLKRFIMEMAGKRKGLELELEILQSFFWKNKGGQ